MNIPIVKLMSTAATQITGQVNLKLLTGNAVNNCIADTELSTNTVASLGLTCVGDYVDYFDTNLQCGNNSKYFDLAVVALPPCDSKFITIY